MPPSLTRRSTSEMTVKAPKIKDQETVELKRAKGEISCAECRRLKLRCNKKIPCGSCIRRGCQVICPNGVLTSGQGSRFILADTDELHKKIADMSNRIRQLEDALANAQATISREPHPMLAPELLTIKHRFSPSRKDDAQSQHVVNDEIDNAIMLSFGDLTLTDTDGGGEALLLPNVYKTESSRTLESIPVASTTSQPSLPIQIKHVSSDFPFSPLYLPRDEIQEAIESQLPSYERAVELCEVYIQHAAWWIRPVGYDQIWGELLPGVYKRQSGCEGRNDPIGEEPASKEDGKIDPHELATLLMVIAVGAASGFAREPCKEEGELYLHLARASLCLKSGLDLLGMSAIQAVCLMASYDMVSLRKKSLEPASKTISFAMMLAVNVGLHRDPKHWNLEPKMIQRRRVLFWELMYVDAWRSVATGRPTGVHLNDIDCELPIDNESTLDENGKEIPSFWRWKYLFIRDVFIEIVHKINSTKPMKYSEILELDGKVREFGPRNMEKLIAKPAISHGPDDSGGIRGYLQKYMLSLLKDISLQLLHRNFFARALLEHPKNPMESVYAPSFLACYNSAISVLRIVREHFDDIEKVVARYWSTWTFTPVSAIILGSVVARAPTLELAPRAFVDLEISIKAFEIGKAVPLIQVALPKILNLRDRAYQALVEVGQDPDKLVRELGSESAPPVPQDTVSQNRAERASEERSHMGDVSPVEHNDHPRESRTGRGSQSAPSAPSNSIQPSLPSRSEAQSNATLDVSDDFVSNDVNGDRQATNENHSFHHLAPVHHEDVSGRESALNDFASELDADFWNKMFPQASSIGESFPSLGYSSSFLATSQSEPQPHEQSADQSFDFHMNPATNMLSSSSSPPSAFGLDDFAGQLELALTNGGLPEMLHADTISDDGMDYGSLSTTFNRIQGPDFAELLSMSMGGGPAIDGMGNAHQGVEHLLSDQGARLNTADMDVNESVEADLIGSTSGGMGFDSSESHMRVRSSDRFAGDGTTRTIDVQDEDEFFGSTDLQQMLQTS